MKKRIKRVLLIFPPGKANNSFKIERTNPPLGLMYLASVIRNDFEVKILDAVIEGFDNKTEDHLRPGNFDYGLSFGQIKEKIAEFSPDLVGISCLFTEERKNSHKVAELAKEVSKDILTVMGGVHPTVMPYEVMEDENIDFIVLGEGENTFKELLETLNSDKRVDMIDGLGYRRDGKIKINPKNKFIQNLDLIPFPARDMVPLVKYCNFAEKGMRFPEKNHLATTIVSSRGCPAKCIFCSSTKVYGPKLRTRSAENVLAEIDELVNIWGIKELDFFDDNLTFDKSRALKIFRGMIEKKYNLSWVAGNGLAIYALDDELLEAMKVSGCYRLHLAVESGSQNILTNIINKPLNLNKIKPVLAKAKQLGFETVGFFIIGFPGETIDDIRQTLTFAEELDLDYSTFQIASPHPGSKLFEICEENNYFIKDFSIDNLSTSKGNILTGEFTPRQLEEIRVLEWDRINFKSQEKAEKICKMMGLDMEELRIRREETKKRLAQ